MVTPMLVDRNVYATLSLVVKVKDSEAAPY